MARFCCVCIALLMVSTAPAEGGAPDAGALVEPAATNPAPRMVHAVLGESRPLQALSVSFAALQALDVYTTRRALARGAVEVNPAMAPFSGNTAALTLVKSGITIGTLYLVQRSARTNRKTAILTGVIVNAAAAFVVQSNLRVLSRLP